MSGLCTRIDNLDVTLIEWQKNPALGNNARKKIELSQFPIKPVRIISHSNQISRKHGFINSNPLALYLDFRCVLRKEALL